MNRIKIEEIVANEVAKDEFATITYKLPFNKILKINGLDFNQVFYLRFWNGNLDLLGSNGFDNVIASFKYNQIKSIKISDKKKSCG